MRDLLLCVHVVVKTLNLEISRYRLVAYVKECYLTACSTIIFLHSTNQIIVFLVLTLPVAVVLALNFLFSNQARALDGAIFALIAWYGCVSSAYFMHTVEPPVSYHPKCQGYVVAYGRWSLNRGQTTGNLNFSQFTYGNCGDLTHRNP